MSSNPANAPADANRAEPLSADELLPPVEPPNARFILQLFIVPGLIVLAVFLLVLLIGWVRSSQKDPIAKVHALRMGNQARWQQAFELAQMLMKSSEDSPDLRENTELAGEIVTLLGEQLEAANSDDNSISLRYFLCRILGEFTVDEGIEVLLKVAREDGERDVRREAINALAVLGHSFQSMDPPQVLSHSELVEIFLELANDQDDLIRSQAAYAIGVFAEQQNADERLTLALEKLADDLYADARYNAALALARRGNFQAVEAVVEMLDANLIAISIANEISPSLQAFKRNTILKNALDAARLLLEKNRHLDLLEVTDALKRFIKTAAQEQTLASIPDSLIEEAAEILKAFDPTSLSDG